MVQETYSLLEFDKDIDEDPTDKYAPLENMLTAADVVGTLLTGQYEKSMDKTTTKLDAQQDRFPAYAILGGFSMQLRGGRRSTRVIDLITSVHMKGVWDAITGDERLVIPDSRLIEGVLKVFVKTGPNFDACSQHHRIEVDIKQAGFSGSPRKLTGNVDVLGPFELFGKTVHFNVLGIQYMTRIKVDCCVTRAEPRDFADVRFMITKYSAEVRAALESGFVNVDDMIDILRSKNLGPAHERRNLASMLHFDVQA